MYADPPDDLCAETLCAELFGDNALARPILGTPETLEAMTGESLRDFHRRNYRADNTVVSLCGSFKEEDLEDIRRRFSALESGQQADLPQAVYTPSFVTTAKPIEQNHLILAFPGLTYHSPRRFALQTLSAILGGGVSSYMSISSRMTPRSVSTAFWVKEEQ